MNKCPHESIAIGLSMILLAAVFVIGEAMTGIVGAELAVYLTLAAGGGFMVQRGIILRRRLAACQTR